MKNMKVVLLSFILFISILSIGQVPNNINKDVYSNNNQYYGNLNNFDEKLPIYNLDSCIFSIIEKVVFEDSLCIYYRKGYTAYNFSINMQSGFNLIGIRPVYLDGIKQTDYFGAFKFKERLFLCWGDKLNELFTESVDDSLIIKVNQNKDLNDYYIGGDIPSLKELKVCNNLKLYFVITTSCH